MPDTTKWEKCNGPEGAHKVLQIRGAITSNEWKIDGEAAVAFLRGSRQCIVKLQFIPLPQCLAPSRPLEN